MEGRTGVIDARETNATKKQEISILPPERAIMIHVEDLEKLADGSVLVNVGDNTREFIQHYDLIRGQIFALRRVPNSNPQQIEAIVYDRLPQISSDPSSPYSLPIFLGRYAIHTQGSKIGDYNVRDKILREAGE